MVNRLTPTHNDSTFPVVLARHATSWVRALNFARRTVGKPEKPDNHNVSSAWKNEMLMAEHSPIRSKEYDISVSGIRQWVTTHLVRHWMGFIPFIHSQREDRRQLDVPRDELPQGALNDGDFAANAQALINISRRRLCHLHPSKETREAWESVRYAIWKIDPDMSDAMVPECVYRGFCPEKQTCGFYRTAAFAHMVEEYRAHIEYLHTLPENNINPATGRPYVDVASDNKNDNE